ncbi:MAG: hypothetical protein CVV64_07505 [Candidatus Wallbacteria bacterium HGW-Wallbacteria-1]|jgi:hypothetical protein|uniref:DUF4878 domain-containing protein n=1 Tax=Candidatus Wallbacteria bacterium HGW-Wallbacteria-1 TaxID=2013854 RepID=A0A2N1PQX2_9BACT|nr:MAG: hypothetical protein CVV64_07505 [Candidatus Wallbacteria bacterium HGW-Wallbacteria-1]
MNAVKIILLIAVLVVSIVALVLHLTKAITEPADKFLTLLREGRMQDAYNATHSKFRNLTNQQAFDELIRANQFERNIGSEWSTRRLKNGYGQLIGSILLAGNAKVPVTFLFEKEGDEWRITTLKIHSGDTGEEN